MPKSRSAMDSKKAANSLTEAEFYEKFVTPPLTHIDETRIEDNYSIVFKGPTTLSDDHLRTCFNLVSLGKHHYEGTSRSFDPDRIKATFREEHMRHILVVMPNGTVAAFCSFMLSEEDGIDVIFIYEIHVTGPYKRKGLGSMLMQIMEEIGQAAGMKKAMLSVFVSNGDAVKFYEQRGYRMHKPEPHPSTRKNVRADYVMPKDWKPCYYMTAKDLQMMGVLG